MEKFQSPNKNPLTTSHLRRNWAGLVVVVVVAGAGIYWGTRSQPVPPAGCTEEAKICPDGSAVGRTGPNCSFANCPSVLPVEQTTTVKNSVLQLNITLPSAWYVIGSSGVKIDPDSVKNSTTFSVGNGSYGDGADTITVQARRVDTLDTYPQTVSQWKSRDHRYEVPYTESETSVGNVTATKIVASSSPATYLVTRGAWFYEINTRQDDAETKKVLDSFVFTGSAVLVTPQNPILTVRDLDPKRQLSGTSITAISPMGRNILVGGSKSLLQLYNTATRTFTPLRVPSVIEYQQHRTITAIANNGSYWLAVLSGASQNRLLKISGTSVSEMTGFTEAISSRPARMDTIAYQDGKWLLGSYGGGLYQYDGSSWQDFSATLQSAPTPIEYVTDIRVDGGKWRIVGDGKVFTFDGTMLTAIPLGQDVEIETLATNGKEWLGVSAAGLISQQTKTGGAFEKTGQASKYWPQAAWLGSVWIVGDRLVSGSLVGQDVMGEFTGGPEVPLVTENGRGYIGHPDGYIYEFTYRLPK